MARKAFIIVLVLLCGVTVIISQDAPRERKKSRRSETSNRRSTPSPDHTESPLSKTAITESETPKESTRAYEDKDLKINKMNDIDSPIHRISKKNEEGDNEKSLGQDESKEEYGAYRDASRLGFVDEKKSNRKYNEDNSDENSNIDDYSKAEIAQDSDEIKSLDTITKGKSPPSKRLLRPHMLDTKARSGNVLPEDGSKSGYPQYADVNDFIKPPLDHRTVDTKFIGQQNPIYGDDLLSSLFRSNIVRSGILNNLFQLPLPKLFPNSNNREIVYPNSQETVYYKNPEHIHNGNIPHLHPRIRDTEKCFKCSKERLNISPLHFGRSDTREDNDIKNESPNGRLMEFDMLEANAYPYVPSQETEDIQDNVPINFIARRQNDVQQRQDEIIQRRDEVPPGQNQLAPQQEIFPQTESFSRQPMFPRQTLFPRQETFSSQDPFFTQDTFPRQDPFPRQNAFARREMLPRLEDNMDVRKNMQLSASNPEIEPLSKFHSPFIMPNHNALILPVRFGFNRF